MRIHGVIVAVLGSIAAVSASADDFDTDSIATPPAEPISLAPIYPDRWRVSNYLSQPVPRFTYVRSRFETPAPTDLPVSSITASDPNERRPFHMHLVDSLKELTEQRSTTLWKGRDSSLVIGLLDGGYFGFRFAGTPRSDDN